MQEHEMIKTFPVKIIVPDEDMAKLNYDIENLLGKRMIGGIISGNYQITNPDARWEFCHGYVIRTLEDAILLKLYFPTIIIEF